MNLITISKGAFYFCLNLSGIVNLSNALYIGERAFQFDRKIYCIILLSSEITIGYDAFDSNVNLTILHPLHLKNEIISNYKSHNFYIYYLGLKDPNNIIPLSVYLYTKKIYVICEYSKKTFYGRPVINPCIPTDINRIAADIIMESNIYLMWINVNE